MTNQPKNGSSRIRSKRSAERPFVNAKTADYSSNRASDTNADGGRKMAHDGIIHGINDMVFTPSEVAKICLNCDRKKCGGNCKYIVYKTKKINQKKRKEK